MRPPEAPIRSSMGEGGARGGSVLHVTHIFPIGRKLVPSVAFGPTVRSLAIPRKRRKGGRGRDRPGLYLHREMAGPRGRREEIRLPFWRCGAGEISTGAAPPIQNLVAHDRISTGNRKVIRERPRLAPGGGVDLRLPSSPQDGGGVDFDEEGRRSCPVSGTAHPWLFSPGIPPLPCDAIRPVRAHFLRSSLTGPVLAHIATRSFSRLPPGENSAQTSPPTAGMQPLAPATNRRQEFEKTDWKRLTCGPVLWTSGVRA
jgi:hypothetical protein